jgi:hypothetical protein
MFYTFQAVSIDAVDLCRDVVLGEIEIGVTDDVQRQLLIEVYCCEFIVL